MTIYDNPKISVSEIYYWGKFLGKTDFIYLVRCADWSMAIEAILKVLIFL